MSRSRLVGGISIGGPLPTTPPPAAAAAAVARFYNFLAGQSRGAPVLPVIYPRAARRMKRKLARGGRRTFLASQTRGKRRKLPGCYRSIDDRVQATHARGCPILNLESRSVSREKTTGPSVYGFSDSRYFRRFSISNFKRLHSLSLSLCAPRRLSPQGHPILDLEIR